MSDMNVVRKQFAKPGKGAKRPRKRRGPPAGILTKLIDFDPLDEAEWLSVARAIGCEPVELDKMTVAKGLTWRAGVECVINNSLPLLKHALAGQFRARSNCARRFPVSPAEIDGLEDLIALL